MSLCTLYYVLDDCKCTEAWAERDLLQDLANHDPSRDCDGTRRGQFDIDVIKNPALKSRRTVSWCNLLCLTMPATQPLIPKGYTFNNPKEFISVNAKRLLLELLDKSD